MTWTIRVTVWEARYPPVSLTRSYHKPQMLRISTSSTNTTTAGKLERHMALGLEF
jgi:hypothetical protein